MEIILFLIGFPLLAAICTLFTKKTNHFKYIIRITAVAVIAVTILGIVIFFPEVYTVNLSMYGWIKPVMQGIEVCVAAYIFYTGIKYKYYLASILAVAQIGLALWFELFHGHVAEATVSIYIDRLTLIMMAIVGIIGSLICVYAIDYMKGYHRHHPDIEDRSSMFFTVLLVFLSAMFGLVVANDLVFMLFFWEITSFCSFLLIGYTKSTEAIKNAFLTITINVFGGLCFTAGIVLLALSQGVIDLQSMLTLDSHAPVVIATVFFLATAGLTKSAQFPFSSWLLGAMVAPTPTSAMLHSSTMVKAGVYMIIRLAPLLGNNSVGMAVTTVGAITFLTAAVLAVSQSDAKKILAYSTISNLGLIVACAAVNTPEALWAAVMLIIFHAIAKSLLFLSVGSTEYQLYSRNVENMDGLFRVSTALTMLLSIGIAGMFVAPFGMLISKWAAMRAFVDSGNVFIVMIIVFGSSVTLFFWAKWMGKLVANTHTFKPTPHHMHQNEKISLYTLAGLVVLVCGLHPLISYAFVIPYIDDVAKIDFHSPISTLNTAIIIFMLCMLFIIPVILMPIYSKSRRENRIKPTSLYLSGENTGDDASFYGGLGETRPLELRNYYMRSILRERIWMAAGCVICALIMLGGFFLAMGGIIL